MNKDLYVCAHARMPTHTNTTPLPPNTVLKALRGITAHFTRQTGKSASHCATVLPQDHGVKCGIS